ncbi:MAG: nicotinic acid mononucleotide adenylyltransferase, partial [Microcystaceae cyanobacterium]
DLVRQIPRWYQVETLLQSVTLLIFPRPGYPLHPPDLQTLSQLGGHYDIVQVELPAIASTHFRVHQDASILPPAVQDYIEQEKLYLS